MKRSTWYFILISILFWHVKSYAGVVINEIQYHPQPDIDELEYIELYNNSPDASDISGWALDQAVKYTFPANTTIPPYSYLVIAKDKLQFTANYGTVSSQLLGNYSGKLSNSGEQIVLKNKAGTVVDLADYEDEWPWNPDADGSGRSLERICPNSPITDFRNWQASGTGINEVSGTPGRENTLSLSSVPPYIQSVWNETLTPLSGETVKISALVENREPLTVTIFYDAGNGYISSEMKESNENDTIEKEYHGIELKKFTATIPLQNIGTLVRYYIQAYTNPDIPRRFPAEAPLYGLGWKVPETKNDTLTRDEVYLNPLDVQKFYNFPYDMSLHSYGSIIMDGILYDNVQVRLRGGAARDFPKKNWRINFPKSHLWKGTTESLNINSDYHDATHIRNALSMLFYNQLGLTSEKTQFTRLYFNGEYAGLFYRLDEVDRIWLEQNGYDPEKDLFKAHYQGNVETLPAEVQFRFDKKTGDKTDFSSFALLYDTIQNSAPEDKSIYLESVFNMNSLYSYMIGRTLLSSFDERYKNFYLYYDHKWTIFPHDNDLSWGHRWDETQELLNTNFSTDTPLFFMPNELLSVIQNDPKLHQEFITRLRQILNTIFLDEIWRTKIEEFYQAIKTAVYEDTFKWESNAIFEQEIEKLRNYVLIRRDYLLQNEFPSPGVMDWSIMP